MDPSLRALRRRVRGLGGAGGAGGIGRVRVDATTLSGTSTPAPFRGAFACSGAPCE
jgi:hypothetical protein